MARSGWRDPRWNGKRMPFLTATVASSILLVLLFLCNLSYLYGSLYKSPSRTHALSILAVNYDDGAIGQSLLAGYQSLKSDEFPTLSFHNETEFPTIQSVRNAVCGGDYWAAIYSHSGASDRQAAALLGGSAASQYNSSDTLTLVWNETGFAIITSKSGRRREIVFAAREGWIEGQQ